MDRRWHAHEITRCPESLGAGGLHHDCGLWQLHGQSRHGNAISIFTLNQVPHETPCRDKKSGTPCVAHHAHWPLRGSLISTTSAIWRSAVSLKLSSTILMAAPRVKSLYAKTAGCSMTSPFALGKLLPFQNVTSALPLSPPIWPSPRF